MNHGFYGNYRGGKFHCGRCSGQIFESRNPANPDEVLGSFPVSDAAEVDKAVAAAKKAFPDWRKKSPVERAGYFWEVIKLLLTRQEELAVIVAKEAGKQINEARADVIETRHMAEIAFAKGKIGEFGRLVGLEFNIGQKHAEERLEPRGVVACITPWNFPMAIPMWEIALTLVYGNTVILKPSSETPLCGHKLAEIFHKAGFPPGVFNVIYGPGNLTGDLLAGHPDVNVIIVTGSSGTVLDAKRKIANDFKKFGTGEGGGKNAVLVLESALMDELAIPAALLSAFKTSGQRCVSSNRIIVIKSRMDEFITKFLEMAKRIKVGDPLDETNFYGTMINKAGVERGQMFNQKSRKEGFEILLDRNGEPPPTPNGYWLRPFVYTMPQYRWNKTSFVLQEEAFAPHAAIIPAKDAEEAIKIYNDTDYGLAGAVITEDFREFEEAAGGMECGLLYHNLPSIGADVRLSFGGVKKSGNWIPSATGLIPAITHLKAITINFGREIFMAQGLSAKIEDEENE